MDSGGGDLIRAFARLRPRDDPTRAAIARLLGVEWRGVAEPARPEPERKERGRPVVPPIEPAPPRPALSALEPSPTFEPSRLLPVGRHQPEPPKWLSAAVPEETQPPAAHRFVPLLQPKWTRHVLSGAVATLDDYGPIDLERVIEQIACYEPLLHLPRLPHPTIARGVCLLVDTNETMVPFYEDQSWLAEQFVKIVGRSNLDVLHFRGCPTRGVRDGSRGVRTNSWDEYLSRFPLPPGRSLLLLTDLGIGRPRDGLPIFADEWAAFARRVRRAGCPLVAFVPYQPARRAAVLRPLLHVVPWDRTTSITTIRRIIGRGLQRPGGAAS